jgi:hypothetical protein
VACQHRYSRDRRESDNATGGVRTAVHPLTRRYRTDHFHTEVQKVE